jgi:hypothetical protein
MNLVSPEEVIKVYRQCVEEVIRKYGMQPESYQTDFADEAEVSPVMTSVMATWDIAGRRAFIMVYYQSISGNYTLNFHGFGDGRLLSLTEIVTKDNISDNDFYFPMTLVGLGDMNYLLPELAELPEVPEGSGIFMGEIVGASYDDFKKLLDVAGQEGFTIIGPDFVATVGHEEEEPTQE